MFKSKIGIGLYIGNKSVSIAQLKTTSQGPQLVGFSQIKVNLGPAGRPEGRPAGRPEGREAADKYREGVAGAIREALNESAVKTREVVTALSGGRAVVRHFSMPRRPKEEYEQAVRSIAPRYIPFKLNEVVSDFRILENSAGRKIDVLFVAAEKGRINEHNTILDKAGLKPKIIDTLSFALIRAFSANGQLSRDKPAAIVYLGEEGAVNINIVKKGVPYLTRDISLAAREASEPKENLLNEIRLSFDYYKRQFSGESVEKVLLCGEEGLGEWREFLEKSLEIPVQTGDPARGIRDAEKIPPQLVVALGLGLREVIERSPIDINLAPLTAVPVEKKLMKLVSLQIMMAVLVLIGLHLVTAKGPLEARKELLRLKQEQPAIERDLAGLEFPELKTLIESEKRKLIILNALMADRVYWTPKLNILVRETPPQIWLREIFIDDKIEKQAKAKKSAPLAVSRLLRLKGSAFSDDREREVNLVNSFLSRLQEEESFLHGLPRIELESIEGNKIKALRITDFEISCFSKD